MQDRTVIVAGLASLFGACGSGEVAGPLGMRFSDALGTIHRTAEPVCGEIAQDRTGTAQGRWYLQGTHVGYPEDPHLALVHDSVDPAVPVFSVGTSVPGLGGTWTFTPAATGQINRDFGDAQPGAVVCWDLVRWPAQPGQNAGDMMVLAELPDEMHLRVEARVGARCNAVPEQLGTGAVSFER